MRFWRRFILFLFTPGTPSRRTGAAVVRPVRIEPEVARRPSVIRGRCWVIDGDTVVIDKIRIRLAGIDAPELEHPWGQKSKWALVQLCKGQTITAQIKPELSYDRMVAQCFLPDGRDLAAELVRCGLALDWPKFSGGVYKHLEPEGARKKLWLADARQKGRQVFSRYSARDSVPPRPGA